jgi:NDP-sugar pyrophosphorylase family protein
MKRLIRKAQQIYLKDILDPKNIDDYGYSTDYGNRDFAIIYIDGELFENETHKDALEEYLEKNKLDPDILNKQEGYVTWEEQEDLNLPTGIASYIKGIDEKDYIVIYPDSMFNLDYSEFVSALQKKYSNAIICKDENNRYNAAYDDAYIETI